MTDEGFKRKLTTILISDVVGYSRLMEDNEEATIQILSAYRNSMSTLIEQHRGRVVDMTGDNLMAEFSSVVDAVKCAVETQKEVSERNADLKENRRMLFRIGVNLLILFRKMIEFTATESISLLAWKAWQKLVAFAFHEQLSTK